MEFAAVGFHNQVEFYTCDGRHCFSIYTGSSYEHRHVTLELEDWKAERVEDGFKLGRGSIAHLARFSSDGEETRFLFVSYLWGWFPYRSFTGQVSKKGKSVIEDNFSKYI